MEKEKSLNLFRRRFNFTCFWSPVLCELFVGCCPQAFIRQTISMEKYLSPDSELIFQNLFPVHVNPVGNCYSALDPMITWYNGAPSVVNGVTGPG